MNPEQVELIVKWKALAAWKALDELRLGEAMELIVAWATDKDARRQYGDDDYIVGSVCVDLAVMLMNGELDEVLP